MHQNIDTYFNQDSISPRRVGGVVTGSRGERFKLDKKLNSRLTIKEVPVDGGVIYSVTKNSNIQVDSNTTSITL